MTRSKESPAITRVAKWFAGDSYVYPADVRNATHVAELLLNVDEIAEIIGEQRKAGADSTTIAHTIRNHTLGYPT